MNAPTEEEIAALPRGSISRNDLRLLAGIHTASDGNGTLYSIARQDARDWLRDFRATIAGLERVEVRDEEEIAEWRNTVDVISRVLEYDRVARNLGDEADAPPPPYARPDAPFPLWHAPKPARGNLYAKQELIAVYSSIRESAGIAQYRAEVQTFRRWLEGVVGRRVAESLLDSDADPSAFISSALDNLWHAIGTGPYDDMKERQDRTQEKVNAAYARCVGQDLDRGRNYLELASQAWLYSPDTDPQSLVDFCRTHTDHFSLEALVRAVLDRVHGVRPLSRERDGVPDVYAIFAGKATVADWLRETNRIEAQYKASQDAWQAKYRETAGRLDAFFATLYGAGKKVHLPTLSRRLKVAFPGAVVERCVLSGKNALRLTVPGVGTYHGAAVGKLRAGEGLLHAIRAIASSPIHCSSIDFQVRRALDSGVTLTDLYSPIKEESHVEI